MRGNPATHMLTKVFFAALALAVLTETIDGDDPPTAHHTHHQPAPTGR